MPTYLQATAARQVAAKAFKKAKAAAAASPEDKAKAAVFDGAVKALGAALREVEAAAKGDPALAAQYAEVLEARVIHHERYEKKTVETEPKSEPASDVASSEGEPEEAAPETAPSKEMPPSSSKPGAGVRRATKKAESEDEEEKAIAASYARATSSYRREMAGKNVDALGVLYGPEALLAACQKALGTSSVRETFGALAGLREQITASASVAADVEQLKKDKLRDDVNALVEKAKLEGRATTKEHRAQLRRDGMAHGLAWLAGAIKVLPKLARGPEDAHREAAILEGSVIGAPTVDAQEKAMLDMMTAHISDPAQKAAWIADYRASLAKNTNLRTPGH